ncbi:MAG: restriction endonuclease subunit S, partial [Methanococcoides sp.]|nr:restriction endonuclease subunit S [Methanococcoides sp.]
MVAKELDIKLIGDLSIVAKNGLSSYYLKKQDKGNKDLPVINVKDIQKGKIDSDSVEHINVHETDALEKAKVSKGDLIVSTTGTFKAAVADESVEGFAISANLTAITLSDVVKPEIVAAYLNSPMGQKELNMRGGGGSTMRVNKNQLLEVPMPVLPLEKQEELQQF